MLKIVRYFQIQELYNEASSKNFFLNILKIKREKKYNHFILTKKNLHQKTKYTLKYLDNPLNHFFVCFSLYIIKYPYVKKIKKLTTLTEQRRKIALIGGIGSFMVSTLKAFFKTNSIGSKSSFEAKTTPGESIKRMCLSNSISCIFLKTHKLYYKNLVSEE